VTSLDEHPILAREAEIIHAAAQRNIPLPMAEEYELWELAAALGIHRIETQAQHDEREIVEIKKVYWDETGDARSAKMAGYSERRREQASERRRERARKKREERANA